MYEVSSCAALRESSPLFKAVKLIRSFINFLTAIQAVKI